MQESNATRNRIWKYTYLDFIFTLPGINQHVISKKINVGAEI